MRRSSKSAVWSIAFGTETVHDGLDLDVLRGEVLGVVGGSGSGKSVLLRTVVGLNRPAAGRIEVFGARYSRLGEPGGARSSSAGGFCSRTARSSARLTVAQNIEVPLREF